MNENHKKFSITTYGDPLHMYYEHINKMIFMVKELRIIWAEKQEKSFTLTYPTTYYEQVKFEPSN